MGSIAVVFPGQGSQYVGMGKEFCDQSPAAAELMALADQASGLDLTRLCFDGPMEELTRTVNLQPAVTAVNLICWGELARAGVKPAAVAGHSLGEYSALAAAGALSPEDCLQLVSLRGRLMDRDAQTNPGAMSAIMGLGPDEVAGLCREAGGVVQPANYNTPVQTVITGQSEAVAAAAALAKERGKKAIGLRVSGAWHSPLMERAAQDMAQALGEVAFGQLICPVAPNTTGAPTSDADQAKTELIRQITAPVRWVQTVQALLAMGVDTFIECGPKQVLAGLIKKTAPDGVKVLGVENPQTLQEALAAL